MAVNTWGPPPRLLVIVSLVVLATTSVIAVLGAFHTGITTDEPIQVMRSRNFASNGWFALDWDYVGDGPGGATSNTFVYGPVAMLLLHGFAVLCGAESIHQISTSQHAYDVRHLGVVLIGMVALLAVAAIGRVVLRHWRWGIVAAAALSAVPLWTGNEMFNVKDVPVATGYALATLGLLLFLRETSPRPLDRLARVAALTTGLVLTEGTRPAMWSGLVATGFVAVLGIVLQARRDPATRRTAVLAGVEIGACCAAAAATLIALYPNLYAHPLRALPRTTESSSKFLHGATTDRFYVPLNVAAEIPTFLLVFIVVGTIAGLLLVWRCRWNDPVPAARLAVVGVQTTALPTVAIVLGSDLYHGLRQLLFAAPGAAVLAAYGMAWALHRSRSGVRAHRWVAGIATLALALPVVDQLTLYPYETSYANLATDIVTAPSVDGDDRTGSDYWLSSIPELIRHRRIDRQLRCNVAVSKQTQIAYRFINVRAAQSVSRSLDCREDPNGPLKPSKLPVVVTGSPVEFYAIFQHELPKNCTEVTSVKRWRHGFTTRLTVLALCTTDPSPLDATGVTVHSRLLGTTRPGDLWVYMVNGWTQIPHRANLGAPLRQATVAFRPVGCQRGCTLQLRAIAPDDLRATIDGVEVPVVESGYQVRVSISARQAADPVGVWVTFTRSSGKPLHLKVGSLRLAGGS